MRSFIAHPAMAAAAMLVLVVGVAGTLYVQKGDDQRQSRGTAESRGAALADETRAADRSRSTASACRRSAAATAPPSSDRR